MNVESQHPNHLLIVLLTQWQAAFREGTTEYELIRELQSPPFDVFSESALRDPLLLFQTHFALYNALYFLRDEWLASKTGILEINGTHIRLVPYHPQAPGLTTADPLRDYYLNWANFDNTGVQDVEALLDQFWRKMAGEDMASTATPQACDHAREVLCIPDEMALTLPILKRHYRKRLHECHPDKGGKAEDTKKIVNAYTLLESRCR